MNLEIPATTHAWIYLPTNDIKNVLENGKKVGFKVQNIEVRNPATGGTEGGRLVVKLGSGQYHFKIKQ